MCDSSSQRFISLTAFSFRPSAQASGSEWYYPEFSTRSVSSVLQCSLCVDVVPATVLEMLLIDWPFLPIIGWISVVHRAKDCGLETVKCKWRRLFTGNKRSLLLPRPSRNYSWNTIRLNTHTHTLDWHQSPDSESQSDWLKQRLWPTYQPVY